MSPLPGTGINERLHPFERESYRPNPETGCWDWIRELNKAGYPHGHAHRRFYTKLVGPIPADTQLHHECRNTACVNPDHLKPLTFREHMAIHHLDDAGRSIAQIQQVRADRATGMGYAAISAKHGVPYSVIYNWCNISWGATGVTTPEKPCRQCGELFQADHAGKHFCSAKCRSASSRATTRARRLTQQPLPTDDELLPVLTHDWQQAAAIAARAPRSPSANWTGKQLKRMAGEGLCEHRYVIDRQVNEYRAATPAVSRERADV